MTPLTPTRDQICARRMREAHRQVAAHDLHPELRINRLSALQSILRSYRRPHRDPANADHNRPLLRYVDIVRREVLEIESDTARFPPQTHRDGNSIRRALSFLRTFGRIAILDYSDFPEATRTPLVELLMWEYRWCFAAAGTTQKAFKRAIGRTGAR